MMYGWNYGVGYNIWNFFSMVCTLALIAVGIVLFLRLVGRSAHTSGSHMHSPETPLDILKRRYANGEIDKKEYEEKRKDLTE
jgi:putative membrane protein